MSHLYYRGKCCVIVLKDKYRLRVFLIYIDSSINRLLIMSEMLIISCDHFPGTKHHDRHNSKLKVLSLCWFSIIEQVILKLVIPPQSFSRVCKEDILSINSKNQFQ